VTDRLSLVQVTPHPWEARHAVNVQVDGLSRELARRGHDVLVLAPSQSAGLVRESRRDIRAAREESAPLHTEGEPRVLGVGEVLPLASGRRSAGLPIDVARTIEEALGTIAPDLLHVHEPFAPSTSSAALRHSRALNVGTFHAPTERILSTQLARRVVALLLGRLDARAASFTATRDLMQRFFPGDYRVVMPAVEDAAPPAAARPRQTEGVRLVFADEEERPALRMFLRALRRLPEGLEWSASIITERDVPLRSALQERVAVTCPGSEEAGRALAEADIAVSTSTGTAPAPGAVLGALAAGAVPVATRLPVYEELLEEGLAGLLFEAGDVDTLAAQLARLAGDRPLRERMRDAAAPIRDSLTFARLADETEEIYRELIARRHDDREDPAISARLKPRRLIDVDLHMHTDHSPDCATPVEVLLSEAKAKGLGAIAVTDHNEVSGAHEARAKADGIHVIVAEEVKTADQGEVIGLFIEEKIPRGMTLAETIAAIKAQGGLVYVPHPFDRMHSVPDYEHLLSVIDDIDAIEVFNPRVAINEFNEEAVRFAAKYRIPAGAGSDAHVAQGLGSVRIRMRQFDGPEEFLHSLREADIIRRPASLLYVQALKFLQTKATPPPARDAVRARRVRRAGRKS
jgi:glycosyltransferase involved in cell wall biosynthesis